MLNYSIIVPYRDKYDLFVKAVRSIPDREDIQIIIVDNAPQPLEAKAVPAKNRAQVTYTTSSPTKGAGCARNEGLKHVNGKYLLFLDADDYFTPEAFAAFDKYLDHDYDIVFFKPTSILLKTGAASKRHLDYEQKLNKFFENRDDSKLRYRWEVPWCKLFRSEYVLLGGFQFEEKKVGNDAWFSLQTGHNATKISGDPSVVYVVTEGGKGQSLVMTKTRENALSRYEGAIKINKFLKSVNRYDQRIRLLGFCRIAYNSYGFKELMRYLRIAWTNKTGIF